MDDFKLGLSAAAHSKRRMKNVSFVKIKLVG